MISTSCFFLYVANMYSNVKSRMLSILLSTAAATVAHMIPWSNSVRADWTQRLPVNLTAACTAGIQPVHVQPLDYFVQFYQYVLQIPLVVTCHNAYLISKAWSFKERTALLQVQDSEHSPILQKKQKQVWVITTGMFAAAANILLIFSLWSFTAINVCACKGQCSLSQQDDCGEAQRAMKCTLSHTVLNCFH